MVVLLSDFQTKVFKVQSINFRHFLSKLSGAGGNLFEFNKNVHNERLIKINYIDENHFSLVNKLLLTQLNFDCKPQKILAEICQTKQKYFAWKKEESNQVHADDTCFCLTFYLFYFISYLFYQGGITTVICSVPTTPITTSTTTMPKTTTTPSKNSFN
jgi:hypothetical protein